MSQYFGTDYKFFLRVAKAAGHCEWLHAVVLETVSLAWKLREQKALFSFKELVYRVSDEEPLKVLVKE